MQNIFKYFTTRKALLITIISMSLPAIAEMALNTMLGVADTIMISRFIGKEALSSVGFANQIVFTLIFVFSAFNTGAVALISRAYGEKNIQKLKDTAVQNITLNLLIGAAVLLLGVVFNDIIFQIYDISEEVYTNSLIYFNIILVGFLPMFLSFSFAAILRGSGDTITPMVITGIANVINIIGNYVLILGIGPFPELGIAGAAWSTSGSRILSLIMYIYVIYFKDSKIKLKFRILFDKKIIKPLWEISLPGAVEQALMQISFVVMGVIISQLDTAAEAAFRILIQIESLSFMPAVGMSIAAATLVGKSLGEKNENRASEVGYLSSSIGISWGVVMGLLFLILPLTILRLFTTDGSVIQSALPVMFYMGINQIGLNFVIVMSGALRGAGDTKYVMKITVLRLWTTFVPGSYILVTMFNMGISGIWIAEILSFVVFATMLFFRFRNRKWIREL